MECGPLGPDAKNVACSIDAGEGNALEPTLPDHFGQFGEDSVAIALVLDAELRLAGHEIEIEVDFGLVFSEENLGGVPVPGTAAETASRGPGGRWSEKCYIECERVLLGV